LAQRRFDIEGLRIEIGGTVAVSEVSLAVAAGSVHCLVGDSGSGKTLTSLAAVGLLPPGAEASGSIRIDGVESNLLDLDQQGWASVRGSSIGYVGQNALGCLHPAYRVGFQLVEAIRRHRSMSSDEARALAVDELRAVDLADPERVADSYPAQLSGGMCQRVALAIALCNRPQLLIADEPTTALDDDTQSRILDLIRDRVDELDFSVLLITHDQTVVDRMADDITTIVHGVSSPGSQRSTATVDRVVEPEGRGADDRGQSDSRMSDSRQFDSRVSDRVEPPSLEISGVGKTYQRRGWFRSDPPPVISDVTITATPGTTIGLVGRSGAGKTTLAQIVAGALAPTEGSVRIGGRPITGDDRVGRIEKAGLVQYVFQNPFGSLNPRRTAVAQVAEPLIAAGRPADEARQRAGELLVEVGLSAQQIERPPTMLSGGQCQRVGIARAVIRKPKVLILDEPVSALDWSIRAEILTLLADLQETTGATYLLISHERPLVEQASDRIYSVADGAVRQL
jgi:ABC-type glutathione transport system ATPase component